MSAEVASVGKIFPSELLFVSSSVTSTGISAGTSRKFFGVGSSAATEIFSPTSKSTGISNGISFSTCGATGAVGISALTSGFVGKSTGISVCG